MDAGSSFLSYCLLQYSPFTRLWGGAVLVTMDRFLSSFGNFLLGKRRLPQWAGLDNHFVLNPSDLRGVEGY